MNKYQNKGTVPMCIWGTGGFTITTETITMKNFQHKYFRMVKKKITKFDYERNDLNIRETYNVSAC